MSNKTVQILPQAAADAGCTAVCSCFYEDNSGTDVLQAAGIWTPDSHAVYKYYRLSADAANHWQLSAFFAHSVLSSNLDSSTLSETWTSNPTPSKNTLTADVYTACPYESDSFMQSADDPSVSSFAMKTFEVSAVFAEAKKYHLQAKVDDDSTAYGKVRIDNGQLGIDVQSQEQYEDELSEFKLEAVPNEGCQFEGWTCFYLDDDIVDGQLCSETYSSSVITVRNRTKNATFIAYFTAGKMLVNAPYNNEYNALVHSDGAQKLLVTT